MLEKTKNFSNSTKVYLDFNATTPLADEVISGLSLAARIWGNPSSIHWAGRAPKTAIRETRKSLAEALHVSPLEIIFTSGASEANNSVIKSFWDRLQNVNIDTKNLSSRNEFITSTIEHPSVLKAFKTIEAAGAIVHYLNVTRAGELDLDHFQKVLSEKTLLVSIMFANNETGVIFPIEKITKMAHEKGAYVHSDCVQALGKMTLNLKSMDIDFASFSAHKMYSLKGTGALYVKKGAPFFPLIAGGGQERSRRGGTENVMGIWSLGQVIPHLSKVSEYYPYMMELRNYLETRILTEILDTSVTSQAANRLPNTSSFVINQVDGETLLVNLDLKGFAISTGAACSSGNPEPSPVLLAIGLSRQEAQNSLRVSIGWQTTKEQIDSFVETLKEVVARIRSLPGFIESENDLDNKKAKDQTHSNEVEV